MKSKFTSLDIAAMVASLRPVLFGARIANVYDISGKLFLLKFTSSLLAEDTPEEETAAAKPVLLIEAGVRFHLTTVERKKSVIPSGWTMNFRKLIKGKQLEKLEQVGSDRVVLLQFGVNEKAVFVVLEMYAKGNIVVTDSEWKVQLLLRSHEFEAGHITAKNQIYPMAKSASVSEPEKSGWKQDPEIREAINQINVSEVYADYANYSKLTDSKKKKFKGKNSSFSLFETILSKIVPFAHSSLIHLSALNSLSLGQSSAMTSWCSDLGEADDAFSLVERSSQFALDLLVKAKSSISGGYLTKSDFSPIPDLISSSLGEEPEVRTSFSVAVDEFYSKLESGTAADRSETQKKILESRVEKIRSDQNRRIDELLAEQEKLWDQAQALELHLEEADAAIGIVNALISKQLTWEEIEQVVYEQREQHAIAKLIDRFDLNRNRIQLNCSPARVWLDLALNSATNVSVIHQNRKQLRDKLAKTREQAAIAIKQAESKLKKDLLQFQDAADRDRNLIKIRKKFWFEKFHWFITSENFIVIAGRDATQNEVLYKKYLKPNDAYVHADIHGAATVIVKNHQLQQGGVVRNIPMESLVQAGQFSLCHSSGWKSKIVTSAYWVRADQVSKTAPTGEYLTTGSFMIRGRKNYLLPTRLEMGLGILFLISSDSAIGRDPERIVKSSFDPIPAFTTTDIAAPPVLEKPKMKVNEDTSKQEEKQKRPSKQEEQQKRPSKQEEKKKKGKSKSKNSKYFSQDEEDDDLIREILGNKKISPSPPPAVVAEKVVDAIPSSRACYICGESGHFAFQCVALKKNAIDQNVFADEDVEEKESNILDRLVSNLRTNGLDEPIHAIPVCGPYPALAGYANRVKVIPGSMKRGKAAKLCSQIFGGSALPLEVKKLVKLIPVEEFSECLLNDVKITGSGISKLQTEIKVAKKSSAKK